MADQADDVLAALQAIRADLAEMKRQTARFAVIVAGGPLYMSDEQIRHRLGISENRWRAARRILERQGLPAPDPLVGKRYWPAIEAFFHRRNGVGQIYSAEPARRPVKMNLDAL